MDPELQEVAGTYPEPSSSELFNLATGDGSQEWGTEQVKTFIDLVLDYTANGVMRRIPPANRIAMGSTSLDVSRRSLPAVAIQWGLDDLEEMDPAQYIVPSYDSKSLTVYAWEAHLDMTRYALMDNLQGPAEEQNLVAAALKTIANNLAESAWKSDTAGGAVPAGESWTTDYDGWRVLLGEGNLTDYAGVGVGPALFQTLIEALPKPMQPIGGDTKGYNFLVSYRVWYAWCQYLQERATGLGDMQLIDGNIPAYRGIKLLPEPYIPDDAAGVDSLSDSEDEYTYVALARDEEFFLGYKPEMIYHRGVRARDGKVVHAHWVGRLGIMLAVPEWTSLAVNVDPVAVS